MNWIVESKSLSVFEAATEAASSLAVDARDHPAPSPSIQDSRHVRVHSHQHSQHLQLPKASIKMSSNDGDGTPRRPQWPENDEKNPFVAFKRHIDQQFASLLSPFLASPPDRPQHNRRAQWDARQNASEMDRAWERAMQEFEDSEKEAKEWYDKVLKQITSRRDEHLESGLAFGGAEEKSAESAVQACPYLPPKEDRVEKAQAEAPERAHCSREYPSSRFLDWVWTGWGGPSTTSEMLFHQEKPQEEERQNAWCQKRRYDCRGRWARGTQESAAVVPSTIPTETAKQSLDEKYSHEAFRNAFEQEGSEGVTKLVKQAIQDVANGENTQIAGHNVDREQVKRMTGALADVVDDITPIIKQTEELFRQAGPWMQMAESMMSQTGGFPPRPSGSDEETELDVFEQMEKHFGQDRVWPQSQLDRTRRIQNSRVLSSLKQSENNIHADGTSTLTETIKETLEDGQTTTRRIVKNLDTNGNLISQTEESKTQDSQASSHYLPFSRPAPATSKPTTTSEVSKMLEDRKQEQKKSGSNGWFWKN